MSSTLGSAPDRTFDADLPEKPALLRAHENCQSRALIDALPTAIYTTDAEGRITYFNAAAAALWGCRPELGTGSYCGSWKLRTPDGTPLPHDQCPMALALKAGRPMPGMEAVAERPDGTRIPFIAYPTPLFDASGKLTGAINMLVDISERKQTELAAQRLAAIVDSSHDAIVSKDLNGIITTWNKGAEQLFGYSAQDVIGKPITILIPADRQAEEPSILDRIRRGERVDTFDTVRQRKDGTLVDISLTVSPVKDGSGKVIGASKIARDTTERKQAEQRQAFLTREIHHRTKNLFAVVQAIVSRSFADAHSAESARRAVMGRINSLAQTHAILIDRDWQSADIGQVVRTEMDPYADRVTIEGPELELDPKAVQNFALAVHELATNAAKYGALSNAAGRVHISWSVLASNGVRVLTFRWQEHGGPRVSPPLHKGFGTTVLEQVMAEYFDTPPRMAFDPEGVRYELTGSLAALAMPEPAGGART